MIHSIKHKGLKLLYDNDGGSKLDPQHLVKIKLILSALDTALVIDDLHLDQFGLHRLKGERKEDWSITVRDNWRITFKFKDGFAHDVNYEDYH